MDLTSRIATVNDILEVSTKPIIYDGDTGSQIPHFAMMVKRLERLGVSAVVIEDKIGLKKIPYVKVSLLGIRKIPLKIFVQRLRLENKHN